MTEVVGVILAGGLGTRFEDGNKLLASINEDGEPIVSRALRTFDGDAVDHTVAVLGHEADAVGEVVSDRVDETVHNPAYEEGQSTSVRAGVRAARDREADAAVFLPGDMPCLDRETVRTITTAYRNGDVEVVVPTYEGRRGNPVLFGSSQFEALLSVSGDTGGRALFETADVNRVAVDDPAIHLDVDTVEERDRLRESGCDDARS
ncbi:NTP transferase domain-containing protein [Natrialbaceae archaeon A-arb3/5]